MPRPSFLCLTLAAAALSAVPLAAQESPSLESLVLRLAGMTAVSGYEQAFSDTLLTLLPGAARDRAGNIILVLGSGEPKTLIACPIDEPGFVVGGIRSDGYLTLRRAGPTPGPLADQQLEGQRVTLFGRRGPVQGVVGVRSTHLSRGRTVADVPFTFDDAYVDVGADSATQVRALGLDVLTPVARTKAPHRYGAALVAAPVAGRRAACAALIRAAHQGHPVRGSVAVAFVVEQSFTRRGLLTAARTLGPFTDAFLLDAATGKQREIHPASPDSAALGSYAVWGIPVRYAGTPVETVSLSDAADLERALRVKIGGGE
jgi:putative aminopeptidase FrvX